MAQTVLEMDGITKSFGKRRALADFSLTLGRGEAVAVIGPSGSGKTTLLRIAALLERADRGSLIYGGGIQAAKDSPGGAVYADKNTLRRCNETFGMVFQSFELFPHMSVGQNIADAPIHVRGVPRAEAYARAQKLLARFGLDGREGDYPYQLSGGEKQRVSIARALAMEPEMILFDEPTSALDPSATQSVLDAIRTLRDAGMTMLIVTHEMRFAREAADRVIFMQNGIKRAEGPAAMLDEPEDKNLSAFLTGAL